MLTLENISKTYRTGDLVQKALDHVTLHFRDNEFVSILGPSGSGKTTLLNIIGGLDRYDEGDLTIGGVSTKHYKDRDWDAYRNHTIGFVFQSYNLIPHQSVLANVELALTIGGISRAERRKRAKEALEKVGLGDQLHKRPAQMSGGQMQRVAIARALVGDPDILLADEPTGALDSETGIQVMELLREVARDRLVIMVTHNPELAEAYSTRIVRLRDGKVTDDSAPFTPPALPPKKAAVGKAKMSFFTSLSLSFNNLRTKKGRTLLTSFAGSIGIIGIALILALSAGVNQYMTDVQKDTMSSYPLTIQAKTIDMSSLMEEMSAAAPDQTVAQDRTGVYADCRSLEAAQSIRTSVAENDLTAFKKYLDDPQSDIAAYIGENGVVYTYDLRFKAYATDPDGKSVDTDADAADLTGDSEFQQMQQTQQNNMSLMGFSSEGPADFSLLTEDQNGNVSKVITDRYTLVYGAWPKAYDEAVLVLNENNALDAAVMYQLGLITADDYRSLADQIDEGKTPEVHLDYQEVCEKTFDILPACDSYQKTSDGRYSAVGENSPTQQALLKNALKLKISGIIRLNSDAKTRPLTTAVAYTKAFSDYIIEYTQNSDVVKAQTASPDKNILTGTAFSAADEAQKLADAKAFIKGMGISEKAALFDMVSPASPADEATKAALLDQWLSADPDKKVLLAVYENQLAGASYEDNLKSFGLVSYDAPASINIYTDSFEDKEALSDCIERYNDRVKDDERITYNDYVALLTDSVTSMVNVVSYVLIAFVGVSLIVSCIMIGIITHISVLERTKEIGILRAIGASKSNISQVFNAETVIIGLCAGVLGVGVSELLLWPINALIRRLTELDNIRAALPLTAAAILILISVLITLLGGLIPAKKAAKKDPVIALRTE